MFDLVCCLPSGNLSGFLNAPHNVSSGQRRFSAQPPGTLGSRWAEVAGPAKMVRPVPFRPGGPGL